MGVIHYIICNHCKIKRDLQKYYEHLMFADLNSRLELQTMFYNTCTNPLIGTDSYKHAILIGFISKHMGHYVSLVTEEMLDGINNQYKNDIDFWEDN